MSVSLNGQQFDQGIVNNKSYNRAYLKGDEYPLFASLEWAVYHGEDMESVKASSLQWQMVDKPCTIQINTQQYPLGVLFLRSSSKAIKSTSMTQKGLSRVGVNNNGLAYSYLGNFYSQGIRDFSLTFQDGSIQNMRIDDMGSNTYTITYK